MITKLILMVGLPRSGKSTIAKQLSEKTGYPIVNPDAVRLAVYGHRFWGPGERQVWATVYTMINALFNAGHSSIILDATNLNKEKRTDWLKVADRLEYVVVDTDVTTCHQRAMDDNMPDLVGVITSMNANWDPLVAGEEANNITHYVENLLYPKEI